MNPTAKESEKLVIKWTNGLDKEAKEAVRKRFGIPAYFTLNGFSPVEIAEEDRELFEETARRGFFSILPLKWCKNGGCYSFISRQ